VAKLSAGTTIETHAGCIDGIVRGVSLVQDDPNWTCRIRVEQALSALRATGGDLITISEITNTNELELEIIQFAGAEMEMIKAKKDPASPPSAKGRPERDM
jgi:hypothetical protein